MARKTKERVQALSADDFRMLVSAATRCLERNAESINCLNVFPVPDGDTGINMLLTMRSLEEHVSDLPAKVTLTEMVNAMARGVLLGARGNSGIILSQFFRGLADGLDGCQQCSSKDLARGFQQAADSVYKAVANPVEGTMLTVIRAAANSMQGAIGETDIATQWGAARSAAVAALARTPEQLSVLREAGVVDAGGQGIVAMLEGAMAFLNGDEIQDLVITAPSTGPMALLSGVSEEYLATTEEEIYGYCTQFVVNGTRMNVDAIRSQMASMADSAVVVGDEAIVRIHVHVFDPGPAISYAVSQGAISKVQIDNIDEQHVEFMSARRPTSSVKVGVVAVAVGTGLENIFHKLGATVARGGQTMNPSVQELLETVQRSGAEQVLMLPNNPNIIATANQAAQLSDRTITVVSTSTIPDGIASMLVFNPEQDIESNAAAMTRAVKEVQSGEVTMADRASSINGLEIRRGQFIGFLQGTLVSVGDTHLDALRQVLEHSGVTSGDLVTIYWGANLNQADADGAARLAQDNLKGVELEVVHGGQPHYHFILSIE